MPGAASTVLALDIGGTKLAAGRVDDRGRILASATAPTPNSLDPEVVWAAVADLADQVATGSEVRCGVGSGGPMTAGGVTVSPVNIASWRGFPLKARLEDLTGLPVNVDNDAKALALGEGWQGAAVGSA